MRNMPFTSLLLLNLSGGLMLTTVSAEDTIATTTSGLTRNNLSQEDADFITHAWAGGTFEIKSSEVALERGVSGSVREFANQMITDHTPVNDELRTLAHTKGLTLPTILDKKTQSMIDELGKEGDQHIAAAYVNDQIDAHKKAVKEFSRASEKATDPDVRVFAARHLAHLEAHLKRAQEIKASY